MARYSLDSGLVWIFGVQRYELPVLVWYWITWPFGAYQFESGWVDIFYQCNSQGNMERELTLVASVAIFLNWYKIPRFIWKLFNFPNPFLHLFHSFQNWVPNYFHHKTRVCKNYFYNIFLVPKIVFLAHRKSWSSLKDKQTFPFESA